MGRVLAEDGSTQPVALLFVLAMCMELVQAFANVMSIRWSWQGAATEGTYCTTQGTPCFRLPILSHEDTSFDNVAYLAVLKQVGDDGAALFTMFLAIMTLIPTIRPTALSPATAQRIVLGMIAFVILFLLLMITIPAKTLDNYYGPTGYVWCSPFFIRLSSSFRLSQTVVLDTHQDTRKPQHEKRDDGYTSAVCLVLACKRHLLYLLRVHCHLVVERSRRRQRTQEASSCYDVVSHRFVIS